VLVLHLIQARDGKLVEIVDKITQYVMRRSWRSSNYYNLDKGSMRRIRVVTQGPNVKVDPTKNVNRTIKLSIIFSLKPLPNTLAMGP
jgi:hypothetical protein